MRRYFLILAVLMLLIVPVLANGPDYGTAQKNGSISLSGVSPELINRNVVQWPITDVFDVVRTRVVYNVTLKKYPLQFNIPRVRANTANPMGWIGIPPVTEAKLVYKEVGTTHVLFNLTLRAYKQDFPYVNLYGEFTYVNSIYLSTMTGADIQTDLPTVIYDNITQGGSPTKNYYLFLDASGDIVNMTFISDRAGFYFAGAPGGAGAATWADADGQFSYVSGLDSAIEYGVTNDITNFDKDVMILRPYHEQSHLQIYNNTGAGGAEELIYESPSSIYNETFHFLNTPGLYKVWVNMTTLNYTIFDDRLSESAPSLSLGDLNVYTYDGSIASLLNGAMVIKTDLDDPSLNGWGTSGISAPGRTDFQGVIGHSYNFSATSTGFSTAYANYTLTTFPAIVKLYLFPTIGASTLEFYVTANSTGSPLSGVPVKVTNTTGTQGKLTAAGFARFNTVAGINYGWTVAEGMGTCDACYQPVSGNVTAEAGQKLIPVVLSTFIEMGAGGTGGAGPSSPHEAAEGVMEIIYANIPSLLLIVFLFLFLGVMGFNPGRMMRR